VKFKCRYDWYLFTVTFKILFFRVMMMVFDI